MSTSDPLWEAVGGLSQTTKMPWYSFSLPAGEACPGAALRRADPGSVCSQCYAYKGRYMFASVRDPARRRLEILRNTEPPLWVSAMTRLLRREASKLAKVPWFRWHDSGDVISVDHALSLIDVAARCPDIKFWLPTQEPLIIRSAALQWKRKWPTNLCVRIGRVKVDDAGDVLMTPPCPQATASVVVTDVEKVTCPATLYTKTCLEAGCSLCWNPKIPLVRYKLH